MSSAQLLFEDDFTSYDDVTWDIARAPLGDGTFWEWAEPRAEVRVAGGEFSLKVEKYTRMNDVIQIFDNPKHLFLADRRFKLKQGVITRFSINMSADRFNSKTDDWREGFASFNVLDFNSAMVFDWIATDREFLSIYERLFVPGQTTTNEAFTEVKPHGRGGPEMFRRAEIEIFGLGESVRWLLDGEEVRREDGIPANVDEVQVGLGLITLTPIENGRSVSCQGQGGLGRWRELRVTQG